jgi:ATP-binding cassette subfamily C (CFTR/MRP) protein 1
LETVDAETDAHIWRRVIGKEGLLKNHARVIVTHAAHHLADVDRVCYMESGQICQIGTHEELMQMDGHYLRLIAEFATSTKQSSATDVETKDSINKVPEKVASVGNGRLTDEEAIELGRISGKTYASFIRYAGWHRIIIVISILILLRTSNVGSQFWLSYWIGTEDAALGQRSALYLGVYGGFVVIPIIMTPMMIVVVARYLIFEASSKLYSRMVESVLRAPLSWFNVTPSGRITARLSSDLAQIDWDFVGILGTSACGLLLNSG